MNVDPPQKEENLISNFNGYENSFSWIELCPLTLEGEVWVFSSISKMWFRYSELGQVSVDLCA